MGLILLGLLSACQGPPALKIGGKCETGRPLCLSDTQCIRAYGDGSYCDSSNCCVAGSDGDLDFDDDFDHDFDPDFGHDNDPEGYDPEPWENPDSDPSGLYITTFSATPATNVVVNEMVLLNGAAAFSRGSGTIYYRFLATPPDSQASQIVSDFSPQNTVTFSPRSPGLWTLILDVKSALNGEVQDSRRISLRVDAMPSDGDPDIDIDPDKARLVRAWFTPDSPQQVGTQVTFHALAVSPRYPLYQFRVFDPIGILRYDSGAYNPSNVMTLIVTSPGTWRFDVSVHDVNTADGAEDMLGMLYTVTMIPDGDPDPDLYDPDPEMEISCRSACVHAADCGLLYQGSIFGNDMSECLQRCAYMSFSYSQLYCATEAICTEVADCLYVVDGDPEPDWAEPDYDPGNTCRSACEHADYCGLIYSGSRYGSTLAACYNYCPLYGFTPSQLYCASHAACNDIEGCLFGVVDGDPEPEPDLDNPTARVASFSCSGTSNGVLYLGQSLNCRIVTDPMPPYTNIYYAYQLGTYGQWYDAGYTDSLTLAFKPNQSGTYKIRARVRKVGSSLSYDDQTTYTFNVVVQKQILDFACYPQDRASLGQTVSCAAQMQDPAQTVVRFDYGMGTNPTSWVMVKDYGQNSAVNYYLPRASTYTLRVRSRLVTSSTDYDEQRTLFYTMVTPQDGDLDNDTETDVEPGLSRIESFGCMPRLALPPGPSRHLLGHDDAERRGHPGALRLRHRRQPLLLDRFAGVLPQRLGQLRPPQRQPLHDPRPRAQHPIEQSIRRHGRHQA